MRRHSGRQQYHEAQVMAGEHGLRIVSMQGRYLLYRVMKNAARDTYIGARRSVEGLRQLVERAAGSL